MFPSEVVLSIECVHCGNKVHDITCPKYRNYSSNDPRSEGTPGSDDPVSHPSHYTSGKYEVIDVIFDWKLPYPLNTVVKYIARAGKKGGPEKELEDLRKAQFYLNYYIAQLEKA